MNEGALEGSAEVRIVIVALACDVFCSRAFLCVAPSLVCKRRISTGGYSNRIYFAVTYENLGFGDVCYCHAT